MSGHDEPTKEMIDAALDRIVSRASAASLHTGLIWAIMMNHDRDVKPDEFAMTISIAGRLLSNLGKLEMLFATKDACGDGVPKDTFDMAHKQLIELCEELRKQMQDRMKLVYQCPVKKGMFKDKIH